MRTNATTGTESLLQRKAQEIQRHQCLDWFITYAESAYSLDNLSQLALSQLNCQDGSYGFCGSASLYGCIILKT